MRQIHENFQQHWAELAEHYGYDKPAPPNVVRAMDHILNADNEAAAMEAFGKAKEIALVAILSAWAKGRIPGPESVLNLEKRAKKADSLARMLEEKGLQDAAQSQKERAKSIRERISEISKEVQSGK